MGIFDLLFGNNTNKNIAGSVSVDSCRKIESDWEKIKELLSSKSPSAYKQALLIADKDLDAALKDMVEGETMGERLKNARDLFDKQIYNKIWEVHKLRNNFVHEPDFEVPHFAVKEAIDFYKEVLISLNIKL